jgi:glycosyltransferase involved in cell wall biosynthesis
LTPSLTIVLPVHNGESRLRSCVSEVLELASELTPKFNVLIVDDGSTDDTYAAAEELSARYPQITVRRNREQRGLGSTLEIVRRRVRSDVVILHDGVSAIDPNQVRTLWRDHIAKQAAGGNAASSTNPDAGALAEVAKTHAALARAHRRVLGFQLVTLPAEAAQSSTEKITPSSPPRTDAAHAAVRKGVGQIPPLPRPKFLTAIAQFALGE